MWWLVVQRLRLIRTGREAILFWSLVTVIPLLTVISLSCIGALGWKGGLGGNAGAQEEEVTGYNHVPHSLKNTSCPARHGLGLTDYWRCLSRTTITAKGWEQDRQIKLDIYHERLRREHEAAMERQKTRCSNETLIPRRRVRRQTNSPSPLVPFNPTDPSTHYSFQKMLATTVDLNWLDHRHTNAHPWSRNWTFPRVRECQLLYVWPGVSIRKFIRCLQEIIPDFKEEADVKKDFFAFGYIDKIGQSLHSTFQPTTYPPIRESEYGQEFRVPVRVYINNSSRKFELHLDFQPLKDEEHLENFEGADAFLDDNFSPYRYRYNNLKTGQNPPAWSYRGRYPSSAWHLLDAAKFFVPQYRNSEDKVEVIQELVQSYPGVGEIMQRFRRSLEDFGKESKDPQIAQKFFEAAKELALPLNHAWGKDSGYNAYTRFLLPLLNKRDVQYYRSRGYDVNTPPDEFGLLNALARALMFCLVQLRGIDLYFHALVKFNPEHEENMYYNSYLQFIQHFYDIDISKWTKLKAEYGNTSWIKAHNESDRYMMPYLFTMDLDAVRKVLVRYVEVVVPQIKCVAILVHESVNRRLSNKELEPLIDRIMPDYEFGGRKYIDNNETEACRVDPERENVLKLPWNEIYRIPTDSLKDLYNSYFDRKEARQRYSLPTTPNAYKICENKDPSPINIVTRQSRQSNIRDYSFGRGAHRLNRFFMFVPFDGSPLLTLGIVDGQRLDSSSVQLSGGAVKGENLTFQYMHFKYADRWSKIGSEHWIDGKGATMEIQMIFTISGSADSVKYWHVLARVMNQLFQFRDKLVIIISVLVDILETDDVVKQTIIDKKMNQDPYMFEPLAQAAFHFHSMPAKNKGFEQPRGYVSKDPVFRFIDFIPRKSSKFYTYRGSLTWPPCFPYVIWSVFEERLYMSKRQFDQFASIPSYGTEDSLLLSNNFRRFSDIKVKEEMDMHDYDEEQRMIRERTTDRDILVGYHDVDHDAAEHQGQGVVGEEIYYTQWDRTSRLKPAFSLFYVTTVAVLLFM